jgi:hypothetical protein
VYFLLQSPYDYLYICQLVTERKDESKRICISGQRLVVAKVL